MATAFVAGATGYTGREVVRVLRQRGVETVAHVRPDSSRRSEWIGRFEALGARVDTTAWELEAMAGTLASLGPEVVFAVLGTTRARRRAAGVQGRSDTYESVDYGLTHLLLRAAGRSATRPRFVYLSSLGVSETTSNPYLVARGRLERELREGGLPYVIVRTSFITGPDRDEFRLGERLLATLVDGMLGGLALVEAGRLKARYGSITSVDLARALVRLAFDPAAASRTVLTEELR
jgi:nucleoside-diphosphate-sugar epimerase